MPLNEDYARILIKRSIFSGTTPTIPVDEPIVADDFDDLLPTDLLVGEMFMNVWDDRMWIRTLNGLIEIPVSGFSSSNYFTTGATLFNDTLFFDRNDQLSAYTVDLSSLNITGATGNFLPLSVTAATTVAFNQDLTFSGSGGFTDYRIEFYSPGTDYSQHTFSLVQNAFEIADGTHQTRINHSGNDINFTNDAQAGGEATYLNIGNRRINVGSDLSTFSGITYTADYSANYTNRSLVDKEYVDGLAFTGVTGNLSQVLTIGNETDGNDIQLSDGDKIFNTDGADLTSGLELDPANNINGTRLYTEDTNSGDLGSLFIGYNYVFLESNSITDDIISGLEFDPTGTLGSTRFFKENIDTGDKSEIKLETTSIDFISPQVDFSNVNTVIGLPNDYTTGAALVGNTVVFDRTDMLSAYTLDLSGLNITGATGNFLPLSGGTITGNLEIEGALSFCISGATTQVQTDCSGNQILTGVTNSSVVAGSGNTINNNLNGVFVAGTNLTATTSNTAYFSRLNINEVLTGTSVNNLGIDTNGNVVIGSSGGTQSLSQVLTVGNETLGNDIILTSGDTIQAGSGAGILNLRDGFDDFVTLGNVFKRIEFTTNSVELIQSAQNGLKITNTDFVIKNEAAGVIKMTSQSGSTFGEIQIVNSSSVNTTEDTPHFPVFISTQDAFIDGGVENSAVIGGVGLSALTSDTVYVPDLDVAGDLYGSPYDLSFAISDEVTQIVTGTSVTTLYSPRVFTVNQVRFSLSNSGSTTSTIDVFKNGSSILASPLSLGSGALITGVTISPNQFVETDKITVDIDAAGTGAAGAKVYLKGKTSRIIL